MRVSDWRASFVACCLGAVGCSSSSDAAATGVSCDSLTNVGADVSPVTKSGPPPAMTGGAIVDGTYTQTGYELYGGATESTPHKDTLIIAGGTMKNIQSEPGKADLLFGGTYTTSGSNLAVNITCPSPLAMSATYTATPTTITLISSRTPNKVETWTKR